jgi:ATP-dependent protease ClpP protease subunit
MPTIGFDLQYTNNSNKATLKLIGGISWWKNNAENFTAAVDKAIENGAVDIDCYINSPGGAMFEANEIGNQILRFKGKKYVKLGSLVASAGTIVSSYFDEIEASSNTMYMIHDPISYPEIKHLADYDTDKRIYEHLRNNVIDLYHKLTGLSKSELSTMMEKTTWMNAEEAKKKGFVHKISPIKDTVSTASNVLNEYGYQLPVEVANYIKETTKEEIKKVNMEKIALALGLAKNATEDEMVVAIEKQNKSNSVSETALKTIGLLAASKGLDADTVQEIAKTNYDAALQLVEKHNVTAAQAPPAIPPAVTEKPVQASVADLVAELRKGSASNHSTKTYDDYTASELLKMEADKPDEFEKLFNEKYKTKK